MKRFPAVVLLFVMALITSLIAGCAGFQTDVRTFDKLPDNTPKGYVEFYSEESKEAIELNIIVNLFQWRNDETKRIGLEEIQKLS